MYLSIVFAVSLTVCAAILTGPDPTFDKEWEDFKNDFKKFYEKEEELLR